MLASASYAQRRGLTRPFARATAQHRRMGQKLSMGLTPKQVARLERLPAAEVEALLADQDFAALAEGYRALHAKPEDEQRQILTSLARHLLMEALAHGDVRVAVFILLQERKGQDPARTLADGVIVAARREPGPAPAPRAPSVLPRPAYPSDDPALRSVQAVEARLRDELAHEHAVVHAAVAADEEAEGELAEASATDAPGPADAAAAPAEASWRTRRSPRSSARPAPCCEQARALDALRQVSITAPGDPPTPRARAP